MVEQPTQEVHDLIKSSKSLFMATVQKALGPSSLNGVELQFTDLSHMGEAFHFKAATARSAMKRKPDGTEVSQLSYFAFSREVEEAATKQYNIYINIAAGEVLAEYSRSLSLVRGAASGQDSVTAKPAANAAKAPIRRIIASDDEDEEQSDYVPRVKSLQPRASEQCMIPLEMELRAARDGISLPNRPFRDSGGNSAAADESVSEIKRRLGADPRLLSDQMDSVAMEERLADPSMAYALERAHSASEQAVGHQRDKNGSGLPEHEAAALSTRSLSGGPVSLSGSSQKEDPALLSARKHKDLEAARVGLAGVARTKGEIKGKIRFCELEQSHTGDDFTLQRDLDFTVSYSWSVTPRFLHCALALCSFNSFL